MANKQHKDLTALDMHILPGASMATLGSIPSGAGVIPPANLTSVAQKGANPDITSTSALNTITAANGLEVALANAPLKVSMNMTSGTTTILSFVDGSSTVCGSVDINTTANTVGYNTSSDERLKTNLEDFDALGILRLVTPKKYERICNPGVKEYGHIAQELYKVLPQTVRVGGEDAKKSPWMVDYSQASPVLWKALIELDKENDKLRKRIEKIEEILGII